MKPRNIGPCRQTGHRLATMALRRPGEIIRAMAGSRPCCPTRGSGSRTPTTSGGWSGRMRTTGFMRSSSHSRDATCHGSPSGRNRNSAVRQGFNTGRHPLRGHRTAETRYAAVSLSGVWHRPPIAAATRSVTKRPDPRSFSASERGITRVHSIRATKDSRTSDSRRQLDKPVRTNRPGRRSRSTNSSMASRS